MSLITHDPYNHLPRPQLSVGSLRISTLSPVLIALTVGTLAILPEPTTPTNVLGVVATVTDGTDVTVRVTGRSETANIATDITPPRIGQFICLQADIGLWSGRASYAPTELHHCANSP